MPSATACDWGPDMSAFARYEAHLKTISERLIQMLKERGQLWVPPWEPSERSTGPQIPYNPTTGKSYSGINSMVLWAEQVRRGSVDPRWMTAKQAQDRGFSVHEGAQSVALVKWVNYAAPEAPESKGDAEPPEEAERRPARMIPRTFWVFHAQDIAGLPALVPVEPIPVRERHAQCEALIAAAGVRIEHDGGNQAFYRPATDSVHMPEFKQFRTVDGYYATVLHELGHASGHPSRLKRDLSGAFGSEAYAREELRAEIASMMAGERLGIGHDPGQHVAYVKHWIRILQDDPHEIARACKDAEAICTHLQVPRFEREPLLALDPQEDAVPQARNRQRTRARAMGAAR